MPVWEIHSSLAHFLFLLQPVVKNLGGQKKNVRNSLSTTVFKIFQFEIEDHFLRSLFNSLHRYLLDLGCISCYNEKDKV